MPSPEQYVIIDWQPHVVRAGVGVFDVIRRPFVVRVLLGTDPGPMDLELKPIPFSLSAFSQEIPARVGLRVPLISDTPDVWQYLVGPALEEAERSGEELKVIWPFAPDGGGLQEAWLDDMDVEGDRARWERSKERRQKDAPGVNDWTGLEALLCVCSCQHSIPPPWPCLLISFR
jgi:actin-related protein 9